VDEVGRGALAGPVVAAAVILPVNARARWLRQVRDSKCLIPAMRERLFPRIQEITLSIGIGTASPEEIDSLGIALATRLAMKSAIEQLSPVPQHLLIDYFHLPELPIPQKGIVNGDGLCLSIACASIIAKVTRDRLMVEMDGVHRGYGFARHKGYGTEKHLACLNRLGPSPIHRRSFQPLKGLVCREE
jgi:ribonuclease HII